jgi:hypothetical protein
MEVCPPILQKFLANNFFWVHFFPGYEIRVKFCVFLILICKIRSNKSLGSFFEYIPYCIKKVYMSIL